MNIYKLTNEKYRSEVKKFIKTPFGARTWMWTFLPLYLGILSLVCMIIMSIVSIFFDEAAIYEYAFGCFAFVSFFVASITHLQCAKYVKEYVEFEKKNK